MNEGDNSALRIHLSRYLVKSIPTVGAFLLLACFGCVEIQTFPDNGGPAIYQATNFGTLLTHPDQFQGQSVRIAGRIAGVELQDRGLLLIADWLVYPKNPNLRPENPSTQDRKELDDNKPRFLVFYSGTIESDFLWQGNEFLVIGETKDPQELVNIVGTSRLVPYVEARCLHIWQTGSADLSEFTTADPLTFRYPPPLERTYCLKAAQDSPKPSTHQSGN